MLLQRTSFRGIVDQFLAAQPASINFAELGGDVIAFVGPNGAGKTSALAVVCVALYKSFPSRPGFYENFEGRDAFVEATFSDDGREITVRLVLDAEKRTCENYIFIDGEPLRGQKLNAVDFKAEVDRLFGSKDLFLASVFNAQNRTGSILSMSRAERKQLIGEMIGLGPIQELHRASTQLLAGAVDRLTRSRQTLADAEAEIGDLDLAESRLEEAHSLVESAAGALDVARTEESSALAILERARSAGERITALQSAHDSAKATLTTADATLSKARQQIDSVNAQATRRLNDLAARRVDDLEPRARERHKQAILTLGQRRTRLDALITEKADVTAAAGQLEEILREKAHFAFMDQAYTALQTAIKIKTKELDSTRRRLKDAQATNEREKVRLRRQTELLTQVPCTATDEWFRTKDRESIFTIDSPADLAGTCPLLAEARRAKSLLTDLETIPGLDALTDDVDALSGDLSDLQAKYEIQSVEARERDTRVAQIAILEPQLRAKAGRAPLIEQSELDVDLLDVEQSRIDSDLDREIETARATVDQAARDCKEILSEQQAALLSAEEAITAATTDQAAAKTSYGAALLALQTAQAEGLDLDIAEANARREKSRRESSERSLRDADRYLAEIQTRVEALRKRRDSLGPLRSIVVEAEREVGDWGLVEDALGPNGVQALEIDCAGPEITGLTNELLNTWPGRRFSIAFHTLREKKRDKGQYQEVFDIKAFNAARELLVESLSGGEQVVVSEAISLAISIFNARKNNVRWESMFRDETTGALDEESAPAYLPMLRRARELGGFQQVAFVSHNRDVWQMADVRLFFQGKGRITLDSAPLAA